MNPRAYTRNKFSAELYKFVRESVGDTSTLKYYFANNVLVTAGLDSANRLVIVSNEPIAIGSVLVNLKDSNGITVLDNTNWQISSLRPVLNAFNTIDSYTMRAVKFQGVI